MTSKRFIWVLLFIVSAVATWAASTLLPQPHSISHESGVSFSLNRPIRFELPTVGVADPAVDVQLNTLVALGGGVTDEAGVAVIRVRLVAVVPGAEFQQEAYSLVVTTDTVTIDAVTLRGAYWATQTLWQLSETDVSQLPGVRITDWPAFRIRGYMHDVGRSFMEFEELKKHIRLLSRYKINTFHWHLTENQGWRLESKIFPQLNHNSAFSRHEGKFYTIAQAKELVRFALQHGVTVIPEIDMPGHSLAFRKAMGHSMLTPEGLLKMKMIMTEACETFSETEWMHIGTDELRAEDLGTIDWTAFVPEMVAHIRSKGKKVVSWNPGYHYNAQGIDMTQMWSSSGNVIAGVPAIDSRYHYINHYDQYADVVSLYNSTIARQQKGSHQYAGVIVGIWNDRVLPTDRDVVIQNAFYQSMLAMAERAWLGGGREYFTTIGVKLDPTDGAFADFERRLLFHKVNHLQNEPIAYVKQTNVRWRITDPFPNGGNLTAVFPPESELKESYTFNGQTYGSQQATGAGIYLRHVWGTLIPAFYANPPANSTAYAYTHVYVPTQQTVALQLEFHNYGRSEADLAAPQGQWDYNRSRVWVNDTEILPPLWENTHTGKSNEITLKNENFTARPLPTLTLQEGWNKVLLKLPVGAFSISQVRLVKWMFTFVFVTPDGRHAIDNIIYSPEKNLNPSVDVLISAISKANALLNAVESGTSPGQYLLSTLQLFQQQIQSADSVRNIAGLNDSYYAEAAVLLSGQTEQFRFSVLRPVASTSDSVVLYSITAQRDAKSIAYKGDNAVVRGEKYLEEQSRFLWKLRQLPDGSMSLTDAYEQYFITSATVGAPPNLIGVPGRQETGGWYIEPVFDGKYFMIVNGNHQMNLGNSGSGYQMYNWGSGVNRTDAGCRFILQSRKVVYGATDLKYPETWLQNAIRVYNRRIVNDTTLPIDVYSIAGLRFKTGEVLQPGLYILKYQKHARKIMVL